MNAQKHHLRPTRVYLAWLGRNELGVFICLFVFAAGMFGFMKLSNLVMAGETYAFDKKIVKALRNPINPTESIGPRWMHHLGRGITSLGGTRLISILTLALLIYLVLRRQYHLALLILVAMLSGVALTTFLKEFFARARPDYPADVYRLHTASFPSGHSMMAAMFYLSMGAILTKLHERWIMKAYMLLLGITITTLVGISRVYLAMHWPTDVLAGWTIGSMWALMWWLIARFMQRRDLVESFKGEDPFR